MRSVGPGDDRARFLADLRALRDTAAVGYEELSARAHYPSDLLKEAENGPALPSLPVLAAYVRACDGNVPEWEERWRRLGDGARADPNLPVRPAGASAAAVAGARAGIGVAPPEAYDPERVRAALRGDQGRSAGGGGLAGQRGTPAPGAHAADAGTADLGAGGWAPGTSRETGSGWDTGVPAETSVPSEMGAGLGASAAWDGNATPESTHRETGGGWFTAASPDAGRSWDAGISSGAGSSWDTGVSSGAGSSWDPGVSSGMGSSWDPAGWDAGTDQGRGLLNGIHHAERPVLGSFEAEGPDAAEDGKFSWLEPTSRTRGSERPAPEPADGPTSARASADLSQVGGLAAAAQPRVSAERVTPAATVTAASQPGSRRRDKPGTWRLLAVIVFAALLGGVLMMLLR